MASFIEPFILLNNSDGCYRIPISKIIYCDSYNSSTTFHFGEQKKIVVARPVFYYEQLLAPYGFIRIHHSTIINIQYLCHSKKGDETNQITLTTGEILRMSRPKRTEVMNALRTWSIEPGIQSTGKEQQVKVENKQDSHKLKRKNGN